MTYNKQLFINVEPSVVYYDATVEGGFSPEAQVDKIISFALLCTKNTRVFNTYEAKCKWLYDTAIERGHMSILRHATASFIFQTNRGVTHEAVRHTLAAFLQQSTRYVDATKSNPLDICVHPLPDTAPKRLHHTHPDIQRLLSDRDSLTAQQVSDIVYNVAAWGYDTLRRDFGINKDAARALLPTATATKIAVTTNFEHWRHIIAVRSIGTTGKPHPEIKALIGEVHKILQMHYPYIFEFDND